MVIVENVIIKNAQESDIRKGWIRINHKLRGDDIRNEALYRIKVSGSKKYTHRMVLGNDKLEPISNGVFMDLVTRNELGVSVDDKVNLEFKELSWWGKWFGYNWKHPDFAFRSAYRVGMVLGIGGLLATIILSLIGIGLSLISIIVSILN